MRFGWLVALCYLGAATHPLLDMLTTYSVQLLSPFSNRLVPRRRPVHHRCLALAAARDRHRRFEAAREKAARRGSGLPQAAIAIILAYIAINLLITDRANAAVRDWAGDREVDVDLRLAAARSPSGGAISSGARTVATAAASYDPLAGGFGPVSECQPTNMDDPIVREAIRRDPKLQKFLKWSILPQAEVVRERCYGAGRDRRRALRRGPAARGSRARPSSRPADRAAAKPRQHVPSS